MSHRLRWFHRMAAAVVAISAAAASSGVFAGSLPGTAAYEQDASVEALADRALDGWHQFFIDETDRVRDRREGEGGEEGREELGRILGVVDERLPVTALQLDATTAKPGVIERNEAFTVERVRWPVLEGVQAEGLLLEPRSDAGPAAQIVLLGDADQTPEQLAGLTEDAPADAVARTLAAAGARVVIPALVSRSDAHSGSESLDLWTNQPHREWIYRQAFQMGRHIIGYEIQQALAAVDWFEHDAADARIGVLGYGEGGMLAMYAAAVDERIDVTLVSGHFGPREALWEEPIYRNVWSRLDAFGDAEMAALIAPRTLIVEHSDAPAVPGPPQERDGRRGAAPGAIATPDFADVEAELYRARALAADAAADALHLVHDDGRPLGPWSVTAVSTAMAALGLDAADTTPSFADAAPAIDDDARRRRLVRQLEGHAQRLVRESEAERGRTFWQPLEQQAEGHDAAAIRDNWHDWTQPHRDRLWEDVIGRLPDPDGPLNVRTKRVQETDAWTAHLVVFDLWEGRDVIGWGYLLLPNDLDDAEPRPAVVTQHGLGGTPHVTIDPDNDAYAAYAARLAERGYVVFSPYNLNAFRGGTRFRQIQRVANPLGFSIFSAFVAQNQATLDYLGDLPYVDADRIGFYGLSYGGKTAMRVGALIEGYAVVICSGDFNEWIRKVTTVDAWFHAPAPSDRFSGYPFTAEYEIGEFDLGHTFNYAEMAALIAPRPFMVERGHHDLVATDEWVAFEYAKVRRLYNTKLNLPDATTIEYFDGGHRINADGAFEFLDTHLRMD